MGKRPGDRYRNLWRMLVIVGFVALAGGYSVGVSAADSEDVRIGVEVLPLPTTVPPATTSAPTSPSSTTTTSATRTSTTLPRGSSTSSSVASTTVPVLPPIELPSIDLTPTVEPQRDPGLVGNFRSGVRVTRDIVKGVTSGKPLAEVAEEILPPEIANVVVPAIRTTSTFSFPLGLALAVILFLIVQRRIDASDPKLAASRVAHDDDEVKFR